MKTLALSILSLSLVATILMSIFAIFPLSASAASPSLVNIFDAKTAESGHYDPRTNEKKTSDNCTNTVSVTAGDVITFGPAPRSGQSFFVTAYDAAGNIIQTDYANKKVLKVVDSSLLNYFVYSYTVPSNATTLRFTIRKYEAPVFTVTKNQAFNAADFYNYWTSDAAREATFRTAQRDPNCYATGYTGKPITLDEDSILQGRSVLFVGDSIVSAERDSNMFLVNTTSPARKGGWSGRIGIANGMNYVINGKSGAPLSSGSKAATDYGRIVDQLTVSGRDSFDYVIANGGINDAQASMPVGVMTDSFDVEDFNNATYAGALEEFFYTAKQKYPTALIGYICSFSTPKNTTGRASNMSEYYAIAKQICEKWGVYCLDLYNNTDFCNNVLKTSTTTYMPDGVHPNGAGYDLITPLIEEWMKAMPHPDNPVESPEDTDVPGDTETPDDTTDTEKAPISTPDTNKDAEKSDDTQKNDEGTSATATLNIGCASAIAPMTTLLLTATAAGAALIGKKKKKNS